MSFLADACALVAYHGGGGAGMTDQGREAMHSGDVLVSPITVWEITRKAALGKLPRPVPQGFAGPLSDYLRPRNYRFAPVGWDEAEHANRLPMHHAEPMDRMVIATALIRDLRVVTSDSAFAAYGVPTV